ncbi:MAG: hypothetical protein K2P58_15360 [Hyphomonadaceae bacterium]|nr:hypothetical protein [Hyphomonadaceae bacterium]
MRRSWFVATATLALLVACSPPSGNSGGATPEPPASPPAVAACNTVTPDLARQVSVREESAVAVAASDLRGGQIAPGLYDLTSATRIGAATGWTGARAVALDVSEAQTGEVFFNWAGAAAGSEMDRWTARFFEAPEPRIAFTCGRIGEAPTQFSVDGATLQLQLQDGAGGQLHLTFQRRA